MLIRKIAMCIMMAVCTGILMTGCEDNDSGDSLSDTGSGSATVSGVLDSVSGSYVPAGVQGITVDLVQDGKTILRTVTEANGSFTFYGVPAGEFTLVFHVQGTELTRDISVGETSNVVLGKVRVSPTGDVLDVIDVESVVAVTVTVQPAAAQSSSNADLGSLAATAIPLATAGALTPAFDAGTLNYTVSSTHMMIMPGPVGPIHTPMPSSLDIAAYAADAGAAVTINGVDMANGGTNRVTTPNHGSTNIAIVVTAEDGTTAKTYTLMIYNNHGPT